MELGCTGIVRVASGNETAATGRTTADTEVGIIKTHPLSGHLVEVRRLGDLAAVTSQVIPRDVVGDKEDKVGLLGLGEGSQPDGSEENDEAFHI